eukprot:m.1232519 g.1232519  ORF g.1232519 m.1232519 type:complete len:208 (-) comp24661_c1_seq4:403-1026(-)
MVVKKKHDHSKKEIRDLAQQFIEIDRDVSRAIYRGTSKHWRKYWTVCKILELSGNGFIWLIGGWIGFCYDTKNMVFWVNLYVTLLVDLVVVGCMKGIFRRNRPRYNAGDMVTISVDKYSFPSGHAMRASAVACLCNASDDISENVLRMVWMWVACVAVSRVVMGRHHVLDVVAGLVMGRLDFGLQTWLFGLTPTFGPILHGHLRRVL